MRLSEGQILTPFLSFHKQMKQRCIKYCEGGGVHLPLEMVRFGGFKVQQNR